MSEPYNWKLTKGILKTKCLTGRTFWWAFALSFGSQIGLTPQQLVHIALQETWKLIVTTQPPPIDRLFTYLKSLQESLKESLNESLKESLPEGLKESLKESEWEGGIGSKRGLL
jgi:hypothetical protein